MFNNTINYHNLVDVIEACKNVEQEIFWHSKETTITSYAVIQKSAWDLAKKLSNRVNFQRIGLVAEMNQSFIVRFFACQYLGVTPILLPIPSFNPEQWQKKIKCLLMNSNCHMIWQHHALIQETLDLQIFTEELSSVNVPKSFETKANHEAYIQFSSGTTGVQKGIVITQQALMTNIYDILKDGLEIKSNDKAISWLPFFHDMGLVGFFLAPFVAKCELHYLHTRYFLREPLRWLKLISQYQLTIAYAPNFAYERLGQISVEKIPSDLNLKSWRVAGIGAEKIHATTLSQFLNIFQSYGFTHKAFYPSYGMAEATLAVSMKSSQDEMVINENDVSCGRLLPSFNAMIIKQKYSDIYGEIAIQSNAIATHYSDGSLVEHCEGYFLTGDLGYIQDGQLFVVGRKKECIIINGQNIWPQEIENIIVNNMNMHFDLLVIPTKVKHSDAIGLVFARADWSLNDMQQVAEETLMLLFENFGVSAQCFFITNRTIFKTSSGKPARLYVAKAIENGELAVEQR